MDRKTNVDQKQSLFWTLMGVNVCCVSFSAILINELALWIGSVTTDTWSSPLKKFSCQTSLFDFVKCKKTKNKQNQNKKQTEVLQLWNTVEIHEESRQKAHWWHHLQKETKNKMHCKTWANDKKHEDRGGGGGGQGGRVAGGAGRGGGLWQTCGSLIKQLVLASALHLDSETFRSGVVYDTSAWPATVLLQRIHNTDTATSKNIYTRATKAPKYTDVCEHTHADVSGTSELSLRQRREWLWLIVSEGNLVYDFELQPFKRAQRRCDVCVILHGTIGLFPLRFFVLLGFLISFVSSLRC